MGLSRLAQRLALVAVVATTVALEPRAAREAVGQEVPQQVCGSRRHSQCLVHLRQKRQPPRREIINAAANH